MANSLVLAMGDFSDFESGPGQRIWKMPLERHRRDFSALFESKELKVESWKYSQWNMFCWCSWCDIVIYTRGYFVCYMFLLVVSVLHDLLGIFCVQKTWGWQVASLRFLEVSCWTSFRRIQPMILNIDPWWFGVFCYQELGPQNWDTTFWIVKIAEKRTTWTDDTVAFKKMPRCENSGEEKHVFFLLWGNLDSTPK